MLSEVSGLNKLASSYWSTQSLSDSLLRQILDGNWVSENVFIMMFNSQDDNCGANGEKY